MRSLWCLLSLVVFSGVLGGLFYGLMHFSETSRAMFMALNRHQQLGYEEEIDQLRREKAYQDRQFSIFAQELGILQARLERFDAIGEKLFNDKDLGKHLRDEEDIDGKGDAEPVEPSEMIRLNSLEDMREKLNVLGRRADDVEVAMQAGLQLLSRSYLNQLQQPYVWPAVHERTYMSSSFGSRRDPFSKKRHWHAGVDITGGHNAPIVASADGVVVFSGYRYAYGVMVEIRHAGGFTTRYGHLNEAIARNGDQVKAGQLIGLMGSTGRSTGPHLHFEVLVDDQKIDPAPFIRDGRMEARRLARVDRVATLGGGFGDLTK